MTQMNLSMKQEILRDREQACGCQGGKVGKDKIGVWASQIAQLIKNWPAMQDTPVQFLGQKDLLEKEYATHSNILGLPLWLSW